MSNLVDGFEMYSDIDEQLQNMIESSSNSVNITSDYDDDDFPYGSLNITDEERFRLFLNDMRSDVFIELVVYVVCFVIGAIFNVWAFAQLCRRENKNRVNYLIRHLTLADLMVVFFSISTEIIWRISITWEAGIILCKVLNVFRTFPLYLSSNIIVCISFDRFYAFVKPFNHFDSQERNAYFLASAYIISLVQSLPQVGLSPLYS